MNYGQVLVYSQDSVRVLTNDSVKLCMSILPFVRRLQFWNVEGNHDRNIVTKHRI